MNTRMTVADLDQLDAGHRRALEEWARTLTPDGAQGVVAIELHPSALTASCGIGPFPVALKLLRPSDGKTVHWSTVYADCPPCWLIADRMVVEL